MRITVMMSAPTLRSHPNSRSLRSKFRMAVVNSAFEPPYLDARRPRASSLPKLARPPPATAPVSPAHPNPAPAVTAIVVAVVEVGTTLDYSSVDTGAGLDVTSESRVATSLVTGESALGSGEEAMLSREGCGLLARTESGSSMLVAGTWPAPESVWVTPEPITVASLVEGPLSSLADTVSASGSTTSALEGGAFANASTSGPRVSRAQ